MQIGKTNGLRSRINVRGRNSIDGKVQIEPGQSRESRLLSSILKFTQAAFLFPLLASPVFSGHELDDRNLEIGKTIYAENCAACHGAELQGQPNWRLPGADGVLPAPPHDQTGHTWHHDNRLLFDYTALGGVAIMAKRGMTDFKSGMPGFANVLSSDEIWDVLAYIRSTWPKRVQSIQAGRQPPHP